MNKIYLYTDVLQSNMFHEVAMKLEMLVIIFTVAQWKISHQSNYGSMYLLMMWL